MYAKIVFPLPFRNSFTYSVPDEMNKSVKFGVRVVCSFGRRILTGYVVEISDRTDLKGKIKSILDVLDEEPIFNRTDLEFYHWISEYYICSLGEALKNSVPYGSEVESKRKIFIDKELCSELLIQERKKKPGLKFYVLEAIANKDFTTISSLQKQVKKKQIYSVLRSLEKIGAVTIINQIEDPKVKTKTQKHVKLKLSKDKIYEILPSLESNSPKQVVLLLELLQSKSENGDELAAELLKKTDSNQSSLNSLEKKGIVEIFDKAVERKFHQTYVEEFKNLKLTDEQQNIVKQISEQILEEKFNAYLLHGVTGSGKTQVYIELAKKAIESGKSVLILVPEISLTPQITSRFYNVFKDIVTVIHSRMSLGERYDSWKGIIQGKYKVVVGARSALFAPLKNIGLIVVDEEHDSSYKQFENIPRYHARDSAVIRAKFSECPVILGSATPSIESKYNTEIGKFTLLELPNRIDGAKLPEIKLVDIISERKQKRMANIFSIVLIKEIADSLSRNEGVILLQNRRGYATQVYCDDCGEIVTCGDCSVPLVFHMNNNTMKCHYCSSVQPVPKACPTCGSLNIKFFGTGTQRVEDELEYHFPNVVMERIDSDSINKRGKLGLILNRFKKGETHILVGTQMVSKGLDFSHVTLVGVISAETTLWLPDFRADERTFQLLTQVAGRAGRSAKPGKVIIQTQNRKHFILQMVLLNNYSGFYEKEIKLRKNGGYPPFTRLCLIEFKDMEEKNAVGAAKDFHSELTRRKSTLQVMPPTAAVIERVKKFYRYQILIKSSRETDPSGKILRSTVEEAQIQFNKRSRFRNIRCIIDIDPQSVL